MRHRVYIIEKGGDLWKTYDDDEEFPIPQIGEHIRFHEKGSHIPPWYKVIDVSHEVWEVNGGISTNVYIQKSHFTTNSEEVEK